MDNEKRLAFLEQHNRLVLPEYIEHSTYELVLEVCALYPEREIVMHCRGEGGGSRSEMAIADLIQQHGNFTALLAGMAMSAHATIFAACARRYVYPNAALGIHQVCIGEIGQRVDARFARQLADDFQRSNQAVADIFARACRSDAFSAGVWERMFANAGSGAYNVIDAGEMVVHFEMAQPISMFKEARHGNP